MPDAKRIYAHHADRYEQLVLREDHEHRIFEALNRIRPLAGLNIVELGAGTGRLTVPLAAVARRVLAFDRARPMLREAQAALARASPAASASQIDLGAGSLPPNWQLAVADHRYLPVANAASLGMDLVIAGWTLVYLMIWHESPDRARQKPQATTWQAEIDRCLRAMKRVLRPDGLIIILETLGTGYKTPHVYKKLAPYYAYLEAMGFNSTWIRTDYKFASLEEAVSLIRFFFGDRLAAQVVEHNWVILPECTGIWWLTASALSSL
jgi:ubiquinone/menaquinone biosynthesis C-methylase UbiE